MPRSALPPPLLTTPASCQRHRCGCAGAAACPRLRHPASPWTTLTSAAALHAEARYQGGQSDSSSRGLGQRAIARAVAAAIGVPCGAICWPRDLPERALGPQSISTVRSYLPYLLQRWEEGCRERQQLWREICTQGYSGSYSSVCRALAHLSFSQSGRRMRDWTQLPKVRARSRRAKRCGCSCGVPMS